MSYDKKFKKNLIRKHIISAELFHSCKKIMFKLKKILAVVMARGGSKGIKLKNLKKIKVNHLKAITVNLKTRKF